MKLQIFLFAIAVSSFAFAADPPKQPQKSTDDALRDSLDAHSDDGYDSALMGDAEKADSKNAKKDDLEKRLKQQLGAAAKKEGGEPDHLLSAASGMHDVQKMLSGHKSDSVTQQVQRQIVDDIQKLIDEAKKSSQCVGQMPGAPKPAAKPSSQSSARTAPPPRSPSKQAATESNPNAAPPPDDKKAQAREIKKWREQYIIGLQQRDREQMLELPSEYFLPEYEGEIEDYFRRLSSGKSVEERP